MSQIDFITEPRVTLIGAMDFLPPSHIDTSRFGADAMPGEGLIEFAGRACYQSFDNPAGKTNREYIGHILDVAHGSVLEHDAASFYIEGVSRNLTHEQVRHRAGNAYSQLSQRYVDESDTSFVIPPLYLMPNYPKIVIDTWKKRRLDERSAYVSIVEINMEFLAQEDPELAKDRTLLRKTAREAARSELPGSCETKIVLTGNMRAWRHMLEMRGSPAADREICRLYAEYLYPALAALRPNVFQDIEQFTAKDGRVALRVKHSKV